jgi:hypothetical protein
MLNIAKAILKAQKEMGNAIKDSKNPFFKSKYADLNSVREASIPVLNGAGISVLQPTVYIDGNSFVRTTLLHESGESVTSDTQIVCAKANDPQALGSAISYARRYGLQSLLCIGAVDDDAEASMGRTQSSAVSTTKVNTISSQAIQSTASKIEAIADKAEAPIVATPAKIVVPKPFVARKSAAATASNSDGI